MRKIVFFLALLFVFCVSSISAFACSCIMPGSVAEEVERADAVFVGTVFDIDNSGSRNMFVYQQIRVTFTVQKYWKGIVSEPVVIQTGQGGGDCGYPFEEGESYLVYAYTDENNALQANICSRTALLSGAQADIAQLGLGFTPNETAPLEMPFSVSVFVLLLLLIFLLFFVCYIKNKKRHRK